MRYSYATNSSPKEPAIPEKGINTDELPQSKHPVFLLQNAFLRRFNLKIKVRRHLAIIENFKKEVRVKSVELRKTIVTE